jgi:uncharacterized protein (TIGR02246 family)
MADHTMRWTTVLIGRSQARAPFFDNPSLDQRAARFSNPLYSDGGQERLPSVRQEFPERACSRWLAPISTQVRAGRVWLIHWWTEGLHEEACMTDEQGLLMEIVSRLEKAWNNGDSVAWTAEFANDADFIHVLGGFFHGRPDIERGHRTIFDTIYKGSHNRLEVEKVRLLRPDVAVVFVRASLTWYLNGQEQQIEARPTLVAQRAPTGEWKIVVFQNTLITLEAAPTLADMLAAAHPYKGDSAAK